MRLDRAPTRTAGRLASGVALLLGAGAVGIAPAVGAAGPALLPSAKNGMVLRVQDGKRERKPAPCGPPPLAPCEPPPTDSRPLHQKPRGQQQPSRDAPAPSDKDVLERVTPCGPGTVPCDRM